MNVLYHVETNPVGATTMSYSHYDTLGTTLAQVAGLAIKDLLASGAVNVFGTYSPPQFVGVSFAVGKSYAARQTTNLSATWTSYTQEEPGRIVDF